MQAIILAAGMGKRLGMFTRENTKCMVRVGGKTLIERMLDDLASLSISRIVLVIGYCGENLKSYVGNHWHGIPIEYVNNPIYDKTNNIYSLYLAKDYLLAEDTLLLESDLIIEKQAIESLIADPYPNLALVDKYQSWMDGTVLTIDSAENITNFIGKSSFKYKDADAYYKTVNIYKFSKAFLSSHYIPFLEAYCRAMGNNEYYEQVLRVISILDQSALKVKKLTGERWYEIDDPQDLDIAESLFAQTAEERFDLLSKRYGGYWRYPNLLDYCYLVNPYFPNQKLLDEMESNMGTLLREYPSGLKVNSLLAGKYFGVSPEYIVVGNGAAELIKSCMEYGLPPQAKIGVIYPTFEEYPNRIEASCIVPYYPTNASFSYTAGQLIEYFSQHLVDTLVLVNPDNPSGNYISYPELLQLINWGKEQHVRLVIDESFVDFVEIKAPTSLLDDAVLRDNPHVIVLKSISKSYGVPGLRLGVLASGDTTFIQNIKKDVAIWNINSFAEFYMQIFGKYEQSYKLACRNFKQERCRFQLLLEKIPYLRVISSQANYFLCEVLAPHTARRLAIELLTYHHILIKDCCGKVGIRNKGEYIRLAIRDSIDNDKLIQALSTIDIDRF